MSFSLKIENLDIKKELSEVLPPFNNIETIDEKIYELAEVGPQPDGKRMKFFYENLYEHIEKATGFKKDDINGQAVAHFIVMKDGSLEDIKLFEGIQPYVDKEILSFITEGPSWTPGIEVGKPVNVRMVIPIQFGKGEASIIKPRTIMGKLVNGQDFSAIIGARVHVKDTDIETYTDNAGMFKLKIEPQHEAIEVSSNKLSTKIIKIHPNMPFYRYIIDEDIPYQHTIKSDSIDEVFTVVDNPPKSSTGDMESHYNEIYANLVYPEEARRQGIKGKVFVEFVVKKDGSVANVKAVKGISPECDAEAVRLIKEGPTWIPGEQRGHKVNVRFILPIKFDYQNTKTERIEGTVITAVGDPVIGCNVVIKGTRTGTVTDGNGKFRLEVEPDHSELIFSYVGLISKTVSITEDINYDITMEFDPNYSDSTNHPLRGSKAAVAQPSNDQSVVSIRGLDASNPKPLVIVDGKEMAEYEMADINPNNIESISVLKDEAALAMYREKGKNGVILINTKSGSTVENKKLGIAENGEQKPRYTDVIIIDDNNKDGLKLRTDGNLDFGQEIAPIYFKDGKEITKSEAEKINPNTIQSIEVIKGEFAKKKYGKKGENGVILIKMKD